MSDTQLIKLTFNTESYKRLAEISRYLRWAEGQVVIEAIHAFFLLAGAESALELPPDIVLLTRAQLAYRGIIAAETAASICRPLNEGLGFLAPLDTSVPVAAEQTVGLLPPLTGFV